MGCLRFFLTEGQISSRLKACSQPTRGDHGPTHCFPTHLTWLGPLHLPPGPLGRPPRCHLNASAWEAFGQGPWQCPLCHSASPFLTPNPCQWLQAHPHLCSRDPLSSDLIGSSSVPQNYPNLELFRATQLTEKNLLQRYGDITWDCSCFQPSATKARQGFRAGPAHI